MAKEDEDGSCLYLQYLKQHDCICKRFQCNAFQIKLEETARPSFMEASGLHYLQMGFLFGCLF